MKKLLICLSLLSTSYSYLDQMSKIDFDSLKLCLSRKSANSELSCDIHIADFISYSSMTVNEIQNFFATPPAPTFPGAYSGRMKILADSAEMAVRMYYFGRFKNPITFEADATWCNANFNLVGYYLQFSSHVPVNVTKLATRGLYYKTAGVQNFVIYYSNDGINFLAYKNHEVLTMSATNAVISTFNLQPFVASVIRIYPLTRYLYTCMTAEFFVSSLTYRPISKQIEDLIPAIETGFHVISSSVYDPSLSLDKILLKSTSLTGRAFG